jgi:hypothetical protein
VVVLFRCDAGRGSWGSALLYFSTREVLSFALLRGTHCTSWQVSELKMPHSPPLFLFFFLFLTPVSTRAWQRPGL